MKPPRRPPGYPKPPKGARKRPNHLKGLPGGKRRNSKHPTVWERLARWWRHAMREFRAWSKRR